MSKERPLGASILAALEALVSLFMLFGGIALMGLSAFVAAEGWDIIPKEELEKALEEISWASGFTEIRLIALTSAFLMIVGVVLLLLAIVGFITAWGLWTGKGWAWTITIILAAIGILMGLFSLPGGIVTILIDAIIIYYLTRPYVKAYYR